MPDRRPVPRPRLPRVPRVRRWDARSVGVRPRTAAGRGIRESRHAAELLAGARGDRNRRPRPGYR
ncbi:hypothetical protein [Streptomyces sp. NPDC018947]|uniref:hypothetical protein n=1 Tax=Streptomyces sp. NPDC018947 TaxID=3365054 RepID=UPI00379695AD